MASLATSSLLLGACGAEDAVSHEALASAEPTGVEEQQHSVGECTVASADSVHDIGSVSFSVSHTTPDTYSNPKSYKSYIWDLKASAAGAAHINSVAYRVTLHQTASGAFRPTHTDTKAECEGITLKTTVFYDGTLLYDRLDRGLWDFGGCYLPHETPPLEIPTTLGSRVRICATARQADKTVIPMTLKAHGSGIFEDPIYALGDPRIPFTQSFGSGTTTSWEKLSSDKVSADAYCERHGFYNGGVGVQGACTLVVAKYNPTLQTWSQVSGGCQTPSTSVSCF